MPQPRDDTADFRQLFLTDTPLLDTRAPLEFARGAFPGAVNLPLMNDEERAAVGTCYKQSGQPAAIALGHELVCGSLREARTAAWRTFAEANPEGFLYCFRGGLRSQLVQQWLGEVGVHFPRVLGGYKAMRRYLIDTLESRGAAAELLLVAGATGSGKTRLIEVLPRAIDLEGLARHRGSAFGRLLEAQPAQIDFENTLAIALLRLAQNPGPVILEDEGQLIGRIALPDSLRRRMAEAPLLLLDYPLAARVQVVLEDYIVDLGARYEQAHGDAGLGLHCERLLGDLGRTRKRLGAERHQRCAMLMQQAFDEQARSGSVEAHRGWIEALLADYYDPMYRYQLSQREGKTLCVGDRETLAAYVQERLADGA
ncbi:MAG: tRNA 2-selenouridine synthase [Halieaceae bacterium]|jgi:tRNA 2-selenouridine synthase